MCFYFCSLVGISRRRVGEGRRERKARRGKKEGREQIYTEFILYYTGVFASSSVFGCVFHILDLRSNHFYLHCIDEEIDGHNL